MTVSSIQAAPFPPIPVTAAGMATALGGLVGGCAASRAGIVRISEILPPEPSEEGVPERARSTEGRLDEGSGPRDPGEEPESIFSGHRVPDLPSHVPGLERLAQLGARAVGDLFSTIQDPARELGRYALILCLPSGYLEWARAGRSGEAPDAFSTGAFVDPREDSRLEEIKASLIPRLFSLVPGLPQPAWTGLVLEDQASFAEGVARAAALLSQGRIDSCLLGGMDSRVGWEELTAMEEMGLLMTSDFSAGFIPGEAAAFLLLKAPGLPENPPAFLEAAAQGAETNHRFSPDPPLGEALAGVAQAALTNAGVESTPLFVSGTVNGSPWNSNEWGYLLFRTRALNTATHWFPAADFGEVGTAAGHLAACGVLRGFDRGYIDAGHAIILLSAECGRKGAVLMRRPTSSGEGM